MRGTVCTLVLICATLAGCGRTRVGESVDASVGDDSCLGLCLELGETLRDGFGVDEPCVEPEWAATPRDCAACNELFLRFYGLSLEPGRCNTCEDTRPPPACGAPPPVCPDGMRPEYIDCRGCECSPISSGKCEPCA